MTSPDPEWQTANQANWDERVGIHLLARSTYDLTPLRAGTARLDPIATAILGPVAGLRVLHLQCHFGRDTLTLAQQHAELVGLDFSPPAIAAAESLADELRLTDRARFVRANIYDAIAAVPGRASFDRVFVSWGALCWLPDIPSWARIVAHFLKPGGYLALAEAHPAAYVFDSRTGTSPDGRPGWFMPYLGREPLVEDRTEDYADPDARLRNTRTWEWLHPLSDVVTALIDAGLRIDRFQEHGHIGWQMFSNLVEDGPEGYRWPDRPWLPLSYSLRAAKP